MVTNMLIRKANVNDITDINTLLYQVHKIHSDARPDLFMPNQKKYSDSELIEIINDSEDKPIFVVETNSRVVGYAFCLKIHSEENSRILNTLYIDDLCVDENQRGNHIGTELLNYVMEYAKFNNFYNVTLNVWALNSSALKFYEKNGLKIQKYGMEKII